MAVKYSKDDNEIFHYSIYTENRYYLCLLYTSDAADE